MTNALAKQDCESYVVRLHRFGVKDRRYYEALARQIPLDADVVHLHHEYSLLDDRETVFYRAVGDYLAYYGKPKPMVTTMHSAGKFENDDVVATLSSAVVVHNQFCKKAFQHPCTVIPMGVRQVENVPEAGVAKARWQVEGKTVGVFGFLSKHKGVEEVIEAVAEVPDVTLLVGGGWHVEVDTPYISWLQNYAASRTKGRALFTGYIENEDLGNFFGACDVMVVPHRFITGSMSLATALGYGKPVIARHVASFIEAEKAGAVQTFRSKDDLVGKLRALLDNEELRDILKSRARWYSGLCSWQNVAKQHVALYEALLAQNK